MGKGAPFGEGAPLLERARPFWRGRAPLAWWVRKGAPLLKRVRPQCHIENLTYWFSIQCPHGVVQVVSTRGVAVSITGCWLKTGVSQIFFYRQPEVGERSDLPIPIRSSDCIGRYNRLMSSSDFWIGRLCQLVLSSDSLIVRSCFLVLSSDFCIGRLCRFVLSFDSLIVRSCSLVNFKFRFLY